MNVIRWEDPPAEHGNARPKPSKYQPIADALRARPGEWAVVTERRTPGSAGGFAAHIRTGGTPFGPAGQFEAKTIGPAQGSTCKVYARFVGGEADV